jgi:hypothetical protein
MKGTLLYYPANDYLVKFHQIPSYITKIFLWHCIKYKAPNSGTIKVNIIKNEKDMVCFIGTSRVITLSTSKDDIVTVKKTLEGIRL